MKLQQTEIVLLSFVRQSKTLPLSSCLIFPNITGQLWNKTSHFTIFFDVKANIVTKQNYIYILISYRSAKKANLVADDWKTNGAGFNIRFSKFKSEKNVENLKINWSGFQNFEKSDKDQTLVFKKTKNCKGESWNIV